MEPNLAPALSFGERRGSRFAKFATCNVRAAVAIVLSLMLVWTQSVFPAGIADGSEQAVCSVCSCRAKCCVQSSAPISPPLPLTAAPTTAPHSVQLLLAPSSRLIEIPHAPCPLVLPRRSSLLQAAAVPIFQWNCTFLI